MAPYKIGPVFAIRLGLVLLVAVTLCAPLPALAQPAPGTISVRVVVECPFPDPWMAERFVTSLLVTAVAEDGAAYESHSLTMMDGEAIFTIEPLLAGVYTVRVKDAGMLGEDWKISPETQAAEVLEEEPGPEVEFVLSCESAGATPLPRAAAPPPGLTMQAQAHFEGRFKYGAWLPLRVTLENTGLDLDAEVRVTVRGYGGDSTFGVVASLPQTSRKQLTLYVLPNSYSSELTVNLVAEEQVLMSQEVEVLPLINIHYLIGLAAANPAPLSLLAGLNLEGREETEIVSFPLDQLPERVEGLASFDCLVLNDVDTSALTSAQRAALTQWVGLGGRLVVGGGPGAQRTASGLPTALLPAGVQDTVELSTLAALEDFAAGEEIKVPGPFVAAPTGAEGANPLVLEGDVPLVVERGLGGGFVDYVALDLTLSPFDAWAGTLAFWRDLLQPGAAYSEYLPPDVSPRQRSDSQMMYALQNVPAMDLPAVKWLAALLAIYVALVGPVNYFLLRRLKRLDWAWLTIPGLTIAFSAGAFGVGYTMRGNELILNKISIIQSLPGSPAAVVRSYVGLFSPARQAYDINVGGGALVSSLTSDYDPWGSAGVTGRNIIVLQGEPSLVRNLAVNQWSMQTLVAESVTAEPLTIESDLEVKEGHLVGALANRTGRRLGDCVLVMGRNFVKLGDVEEGESKEVNLDLAKQNLDHFEELAWRIMEEQRLSDPDDRQGELKRMVLENVFNPYEGWMFRTVTSPDVIFLGWLDESPPDVAVEGYVLTAQETSLFLTQFSFSFGGERVSVPAGIYSPQVIESSGDFWPCDPTGVSFGLGMGWVTVELRPPAGLSDLAVEEMRLVLGSDGGPWEAPTTSLYDWQSEDWMVVEDASIGRNEVENPTRFVEPSTGAIRVKLEGDGGGMGGCLWVDVELELRNPKGLRDL